VLADRSCNAAKRDRMLHCDHLARWTEHQPNRSNCPRFRTTPSL
jgi:hypothetical protein